MRILVIVESPNKVKKIQEYLNQIKEPVPREALICPSDKPVGDHNQNFVVQATVGHLLDLNKEKGALGIDLENQFAPDYKPIAHQARVIADLKKSAKQADQIWIASDQDQEGEFIGYSLCRILSLPVQTTRRLMFNEITLSAIKTAVENPTTLNLALIDAQKCRRIIDRLIGFQLSRLARRVNAGISVGRVKTVLVRLVADRQSAIDQFKTDSHFRLTGTFKLNNTEIKNDPNSIIFQAYAIKKLTASDQARAYLEKCLQTPDLFRFQKTTDQIQLQKAPPPFKTASLQKDGSRQLKMSPKAVLSLAQKLYESGLISYPRTDTTNLPIEKQMEIQQLIESKYGPEYYQNNSPPEPIAKAKVKAKANTQGAHSAIYPTDLKVTSVPEVDNSDQLNRVYQMIYRRTIASQMKPARYRVLKLYFNTNLESPNTIDWQSNFKSLVFPGYLIVYQKSEPVQENEDETEPDTEINSETSVDQTLLDQLSKLTPATPIHYQQIQAKQQWSQPPTYYDSAGVLDQLEKHGIGRPSTWGHMLEECLEMNFIQKVPIIEPDSVPQTCLTITPESSIKETQTYVQPQIQRNRIKTTELGQMSIDFVREHFDNIFNYKFTGQLETRLNQIEQQTENWVNVTNDLYQMYRPKMETLLSKDSTAQIKDMKSEKRELGLYQGQPVLAYYGRYGPVLQIGKYSVTKTKSAKSAKSIASDESSVQYYPIKEPYQWQTIQLENLPNLMTVPRELGKIKKQAVILKQSQYGYYLYYQKRTYSLKPEYFQPSIEVDDQALVTQHLDQLDFEKIRDDLTRSDDQSVQVGPYLIRPGPYGPYFKAGNLNISVPASYRQNIENITLEQCQEWINNRNCKKVRAQK